MTKTRDEAVELMAKAISQAETSMLTGEADKERWVDSYQYYARTAYDALVAAGVIQQQGNNTPSTENFATTKELFNVLGGTDRDVRGLDAVVRRQDMRDDSNYKDEL